MGRVRTCPVDVRRSPDLLTLQITAHHSAVGIWPEALEFMRQSLEFVSMAIPHPHPGQVILRAPQCEDPHLSALGKVAVPQVTFQFGELCPSGTMGC